MRITNNNNHQLAVIAVVAVLATLGTVAVVEALPSIQLQEAETAGCPINTPAANASKGRCFRG